MQPLLPLLEKVLVLIQRLVPASMLERFLPPVVVQKLLPENTLPAPPAPTDRETLLAYIAGSPDLQTAITWGMHLMAEPSFAERAMEMEQVFLAQHKIVRPFNETAIEWAKHRNQEAVSLLSCDRILQLSLEPSGLHLVMNYRDVIVRWDKKSKQLKPQRVQGRELVNMQNLAKIARQFPTTTPVMLSNSFRKPSPTPPPPPPAPKKRGGRRHAHRVSG